MTEHVLILTIIFPKRFYVLKKRWFQFTVVLLVYIYSLLMNIQLPIYYQLEFDNSQKKAFCNISLEIYNSNLWKYLFNVLFFGLLLNLILIIIIVVYVFISRKKTSRNLGQLNRNSAIRDRKFAINSIILGLISFLLRIPFFVGLLASSHLNLQPDQFELMFTILVTLIIFYNAAQFFINIAVNSIFYQELCTMIYIRDENISSTCESNCSLNHFLATRNELEITKL